MSSLLVQPYGDPSELNTDGLIKCGIGKETLRDIVLTYLNLLNSSAAVYEKNGDYALGLFSSGWCRLMDDKSRQLCNTGNNEEALNCGKWHCHESCWEISKASITERKSIDKECSGGIRIYAEPVYANGEVIGSLNFGYGNPPNDNEKLKELAEKYSINVEELLKEAKKLKPIPDHLMGLAKSHIKIAAKLVGETIERNIGSEQIRKLSQVLEKSHASIIITDKDGNIEYANPYFEKLTGYSAKEVLGMNPWFLKPGETPSEQYKQLWETIQSGNTWKGEFQNKKKNGELYWEATLISPVMESGKITNFIAFMENITERKKAEEELQGHREHLEELVEERTSELTKANERLCELDHLKSMFLASMSHELRTPLNSIIGFTGVILQGMAGEINPKQKDYLGRVKKSSKHLLGLINDVIDISKIESGSVETIPEHFNLDEVINEAVDCACGQETKNKAIKFKVEVPAGLGIYSDRKRVLQCLLNYLSNAVKFSGGGCTIVSAREVGEEIEVAVEDAGIGIAETDLPKLFRQFERLDSSLKIPAGGTGLGLYLTKKLATEVLDGSVWVESKLGVGSKFFLKFPKNLILQKSK